MRARTVEDTVLSTGMEETREALAGWRETHWRVLIGWFSLSIAIAVTLLGAVWVTSGLLTPDVTPWQIPGYTEPSGLSNMLPILWRNGLVLALHATACIAGFIAGSSMPLAAEQRIGISRWVHVKAGQFAICFVSAVTLFSLSTQALYLGFQGSTLAYQLHVSRLELIASVLPHALIELTALFLPLAAWLIASRRGQWKSLLAATAVTVAIAIPMLLLAATIEVYLWPHLLRAMSDSHYSLEAWFVE